MWDNMTIGKGNKGNSAMLCFQIKGKHSISENQVSYWISDLIFGYGMTIFKDTTHGKKLTKMIDDNKSLDTILNYLNKLMLSRLKVEDVMNGINIIKEKAYVDGRNSMKYDFRDLLDL